MRRSRSTYTPLPVVPAAVVPRLAAVLAVLSGMKTVTAAAQDLGLSRNRFQSLMHRSLEALVTALAVQPSGRPAKSSRVRQLEAELARLARENARLASQVGMGGRLLEVMGGVLQGRIRATGRQRRKRSPSGSARERGEESDPEARRRRLLAQADAMRQLTLPAAVAAGLVGVGVATLRRWRARRAGGLPLTCRRRSGIDPALAARAQQRVRALHGQIGAAALGHAIGGLSRRAAAAVKAATLVQLERERKAALTRIRIGQPDIVRGLDAMYLPGRPQSRYALIAADSAVPYRTSVTVGARYDAMLVTRALECDLEAAGAPLVYRLDRARCHDTPSVRALLAAHQILLLHGPPHHPGYYGQLERQNREHRAWIAADAIHVTTDLASRLRQMVERVNGLWPRRSLGWRTAADAWSARPPLNIDRQALREEVMDRAARIARTLNGRGQPADLAERLAIEQTLTRMGYLRQDIGGWC